MPETALEERMAKIEWAFVQIDHRLGRVEAELSEIRGELRSLYRTMLSVLIPMWVTIIGAVVGVALTR
ncbi:MAG: hypothetical protein ABID40_05305 [Candidatus Bipolaricaulota bacterium]